MAFALPELPYAYDALEPHLDAKTMEIHHDKHHAAYTDNFNKAAKEAGLEDKTAEEIFAEISKHPMAVRNHGGGFYNHSLYWESMTPENTTPSEELKAAIDVNFESMDNFKEEFNKAAATQFGSGWAWLVKTEDGTLKICNSPNQDNPLMDTFECKGTPLLLLDVWEHAYYLKYQNKRPDFIQAFWNVVNWDQVSKRFSS